eukprot:286387_1
MTMLRKVTREKKNHDRILFVTIWILKILRGQVPGSHASFIREHEQQIIIINNSQSDIDKNTKNITLLMRLDVKYKSNGILIPINMMLNIQTETIMVTFL